MGRRSDIWSILSDLPVSDWDDDQRVWTDVFLGGNNDIILDYECKIFQTLDRSFADLSVNQSKCIMHNNVTGQDPCFLHGNGGPRVKIQLNWLENYLGNHWSKSYGYINKNKFKEGDGSEWIYVAIIGKNSDHCVRYLNYPHMKVRTYSDANRTEILRDFERSDCRFLFVWECDVVAITDNRILHKLVNKALRFGVIAPMVAREGTLWSNFWGDVSDSNYYARSQDYLQILNREQTGIWNVPYISSSIYMMHIDVIKRAGGGLYDLSGTPFPEGDYDVAFCYKLRRAGEFMYVDNLIPSVGYIFPEGHVLPNPKAEVTLFEYKTRKDEWSKKYFHPDYLAHKHNDAVAVCPDAFMMRMFSDAFCADVISIMESYGSWSAGANAGSAYHDSRISNVEEHPTQDIHLNQIGLEETWKEIITDHFSTIASALYAPYKTKGLNIAFVVRYSVEGQKELRPHHDAATYTVNVALNEQGKDYEGGGCKFIRQNVTVTGQEPGSIIMHPGRLTHYHQGLPVTSGVRYILVSFIN
jgi:hypothetical protein